MYDTPAGTQAAAKLLHPTVTSLESTGASKATIEALLLTFDRMNETLTSPEERTPLNVAVSLQ